MMIVLLRHADRLPADELSPAGIERAKLLARMLADSGVTKAYCSDAARTAQTLQPLKDKLGAALSVTPMAVDGGVDVHAQAIADAIALLPPAAVAVVVGHSNTVGPIIAKLGGGPIDDIADTEFDKLFVLSRAPGGTASLLKLRYGPPT